MITPLRNRVLVRPLVDKQSGAIEIPDEYKQSQTVEVIAVGESMKDILAPRTDTERGDTVLLHPNAAWTNVEIEGEQLRVVNDEYLLAIFETT